MEPSVSQMGDVLAGPLYDEEGILTAELDMSEIAQSRFDFDVTGHYARPDVFQLIVNECPTPPVEYRNRPARVEERFIAEDFDTRGASDGCASQ